ncbi:MAG: DEAD/DEAH box helicase [Candidatus Eremiobacteraeota bacterium]|nr:DEAD/DEAH box helicase [Candidatus Eremiobacteraeota bacterium]
MSDAQHTDIWERIEDNVNTVAHAHELIRPDEHFELTDDQLDAVRAISDGLAAGRFEFLLKAPTGSGKTEVMFRVAVNEALRTGGYVVLVAPTRDLVRQDCTYFRDRLDGTGLGVGEVHGGISPAERRTMLDGLARGTVRFIIGSAMMISNPPLWDLLDRSALTIVDDVNAFDEREHLRLLEGLDCPLLFASATPNELRTFLERVGAFGNAVSMRAMPFDVLLTKVHRTVGVWGEPATEQLARADGLIREHLARKSRIFVIARTRGDVPKLAKRLEETYGIEVQQLRGDMADSAEHKKRNRRSGVTVYGNSTRVEEMRAFREGAPALLAATNLVGSGLDIPAADLIVITDSDAFGESEVEQLIGRVGRRERPSDAVLLTETTFEKNPSRAMGASGRALSFRPTGMRANSLRFRR